MQGAKIVTFLIHLIYTFAPSVSQIYLVISYYLLQFLFCKRFSSKLRCDIFN